MYSNLTTFHEKIFWKLQMPTQKVNLTELECFCHVNNKFRNEIKYFESKRQLSGKGVNMEQTQKYKKQDFFHKLLTEKKSFQSLLVHTCDIFQQLFNSYFGNYPQPLIPLLLPN